MDRDSNKQASGWGKLVAAFALVLAVFAIQFAVALPAFIANGETAGNTLDAELELASGVVAMVFIAALGGSRLVRIRRQGMRFALRAMLWILAIDVLFVGLGLAEMLASGEHEAVSPTWPLSVILTAALCLGVGMFEEGVFRGLILHGLLARMGTAKSGVAGAVLISSLLFGLVHVVIGQDVSLDAVTLAQMALKTLQAGILGFIFAVIVLKTENIWPAVAMHAANDFILLFLETGVWEHELETNYVASGGDGVALIVSYSILCLLYLPSLVYCIRAFKTLPAPDRGAFMQAPPSEPQTASRT